MGACSCAKLKKQERVKATISCSQATPGRKTVSNSIARVNYLTVNEPKQVPILKHPTSSLLYNKRHQSKIQPEEKLGN
jgi:hypothetical protein